MSNQSFISQLQQDIAGVQALITSAGAPSNEAQTESLVIDPILKMLGYATTDYVKRSFSSVASNFPDYTVLPNHPKKWVLEVKRYGHIFKSQDEIQATNYGFHGATDWAVLTNGRTWYIYNIPLKSSSRRVLQIDNLFADKNAVHILACLSKHGMLQDALTEAWNMKRVAELIESEMKASGSSLRDHLRQMVKQKINLDVTDDLVGDALTTLSINHPKSIQSAAVQTSNPVFSPAGATVGLSNVASYTFGEILANPLLGTKQRPKAVDFGDGIPVDVKTWAETAKIIIERIGSQFSLPALPFTSGSKGKNYFLNTSPTHSDGGKMRSHRIAQVGSTAVYIDTHRSVRDLSACLVIFLKTINVPLDAVKVSI